VTLVPDLPPPDNVELPESLVVTILEDDTPSRLFYIVCALTLPVYYSAAY